MSPYAMPRSLVLAASAGTGKTHALVGIVLHRLVLGRPGDGVPLDPSRVVATTFSRKAAAEIRARVATELDRLASSPAESVYIASLRGGGAGERLPRALSDAALAERARKALARLPGARFGTLHGFATGIVRAYAVELGIGPGFDLASEADVRARTEDAIARALERALDRDASSVRALADAAGGIDALVKELRFLLARLEEDGRPARSLVVPDDEPALERRMRLLEGHAQDLLGAPRFEQAARAFLAARAGEDFARLEDAAVDLFAVAARGKKSPEVEAFALFREELPGGRNDEKGRTFVRTYLARHRFAELASIARDVLAETEEELGGFRARDALGFGEVLRATRMLLAERPHVAEDVASGMDALFVDEFQDTSRVQRDILQLLWCRPETRRAGEVPPLSAMRDEGLLVVGDRKQSIYGFRGADVGVFAELAVGLAGEPARAALGIPMGITWQPAEPLADFAALRHNRRSVAPILAFANAFSQRRFVPGTTPTELYEIAYVPDTEDLLVPPEKSSSDDAHLGARTTWLDVRPKGATSSRLDEALVIAERIGTLVGGPMTIGVPPRPVAYRDVAVLATSNAMLDATAFALAQARIPYVVSGKSFFRAREVRDLAAMLALVLDPRDRLAAAEVLRGPWCAAHDETLLGLTEERRGLVPPWSWTAPPRPGLIHDVDRPRVEAVSGLVLELSRTADRLGPGRILREAVTALDLEDVLSSMPRGEQRVANVEKLLAIADRHADPRAFKTMLDEAAEQQAAESEAATFSEEDDAVRLLTVHASKGLDFPVVFVPEIAAGPPRSTKGAVRFEIGSGDEPNAVSVRIPDPNVTALLEPPSFTRAYETTKRRERAERQRLAYVAVTRAESLMFLVGGTTRAPDAGGQTSLGAIADIAAGAASRELAHLAVEAASVPEAGSRGPAAATDTAPAPAPEGASRRVGLPMWTSLSIAPTALADLDHCARRFELVHVLGLPEHPRGARASTKQRPAFGLDARAMGTLAHEVLEHVPAEAFGGPEAEAHASRVLGARGVPDGRPEHDEIVARVARFLRGTYAQRIGEASATIHREVSFVLPVDDGEGRTVVLRGSMDLVVAWPGGEVDVIDYKSARAGETAPYAFQLDVYALAARARYPDASRLRAGLVFLGGNSSVPSFRTLPDDAAIRARLSALGPRLVEARWSARFPRVPLARCEAIHCGFIGRCHPRSSEADPSEADGTDA